MSTKVGWDEAVYHWWGWAVANPELTFSREDLRHLAVIS